MKPRGGFPGDSDRDVQKMDPQIADFPSSKRDFRKKIASGGKIPLEITKNPIFSAAGGGKFSEIPSRNAHLAKFSGRRRRPKILRISDLRSEIKGGVS